MRDDLGRRLLGVLSSSPVRAAPEEQDNKLQRWPMDLPPLVVDVKLLNLLKYYYVSGDAPVNYLWVVFFKIDGETASLAPNLHLQGTATVIGTAGDHGDIGDDGNEGTRLIPSTLGELQTRLISIPVDPSVVQLVGMPAIPAIIGCVALILVQNDTPDAAVAAGHAALNSSLEQQLNAFIPTLGFGHTTVTQTDIQNIKQAVEDAVTQAIKNALSTSDKIFTWLGFESQDEILDNYDVGGPAFLVGQDDLLKAPSGTLPLEAMVSVRGQRTRGGPRNQVLMEWILNGQVTGQTPFWMADKATIAPGKSQDWWFSWGGDGDVGPQLIQAEPMDTSGELTTTEIAESRDNSGHLTYNATVRNDGPNPVTFRWRGGGV
jgi:hypothetical protein